MNDDKLTSADQDAWVALAETVRVKLAELTQFIPIMKPDEVKQFMDSLSDAFWFHRRALTWDKWLELENARVTAD